MSAITGSLVRFRPLRLFLFCSQKRTKKVKKQKVISDGIEPPLSDLGSEVLPLHHETVVVLVCAFPLHVVVRWPSGLRRYVQVVVSSGAWVRTPPSPLFFGMHYR
jgi:hypothetical protein